MLYSSLWLHLKYKMYFYPITSTISTVHTQNISKILEQKKQKARAPWKLKEMGNVPI